MPYANDSTASSFIASENIVLLLDFTGNNGSNESPVPVISMVNQAACRLLGYESCDIVGQPLNTLIRKKPEYDWIYQQITNLRDKNKLIPETEIGFITKDGDELAVILAMHTLGNCSNQSLIVCFAKPLSANQDHLEKLVRLANAVEQSPGAVVITNTDGIIEYVNPRFSELTGYTEADVKGRSPKFLQSGRTASKTYEAIRNSVWSGETWHGEILNKKKNGDFYWALETVSAMKNARQKITHYLSIQEDITLRKRIEKALADSEQRKRLIVDSALDAIIMIDDAGIIIDWNPQAESLLGRTRKEAIGLPLDETIIPKRYREAHKNGLQHLKNTGNGPALNKLMEISALHRDGTEFPIELFITPLWVGDSHVCCGFIRDIRDRKRAEEKIRNVQIKLAISEHEMRIARQIQESLFPASSLVFPDISVHGYCLPTTHVGGDYFDYFCPDSNLIDIVIADVSGHSVGPALFMVEARSTFRAGARHSRAPSDTLSLMNEMLFDDLNRADHFISMFFMQYDRSSSRLRYANAGHQPPLLFRRRQRVCELLDTDGMVLGVQTDIEFRQKQLSLEPGDVILLYTDGVIEAENTKGDFFGRERLCDCLGKLHELSPAEIIQSIVEQLKGFCKPASFRDDLTLLVLQLKLPH